MSLFYHLFANKNWGMRDLMAFRNASPGWHDLILGLSSRELELRSGSRPAPPKRAVRTTRFRK